MPTLDTSAFSSSAENPIEHALIVTPEAFDDTGNSSASLEVAYEVRQTAESIISQSYRKIALQFPDELLHDSVAVYQLLAAELGPEYEIYVLADTSYGSCCVDEVAAQHVDADIVVHYGHACLSPTARLPVIYVFGKRALDIDHASQSLVDCSRDVLGSNASRPILLRYDDAYAYKADDISRALRSLVDSSHPIVHTTLPRYQPGAAAVGRISSSASDSRRGESQSQPLSTAQTSTDTEDGARWDRHRQDNSPEASSSAGSIIYYIGGESLGLTNLIMTHSDCEVFSYDPTTRIARSESPRTNKLLMRRYALVQRARDADVFGILVGTLAVALYLPLMQHLRRMLARAKKKTYTISVGKLNPAKLANFMEIECFVLVACPENSLVDSRDFFKPIITPFELELALKPEPTWSGKFLLDFQQVLSASDHLDDVPVEDDGESEDDQPTFSLATGKYRKAKQYGAVQSAPREPAGAVTLRHEGGSLIKGVQSAGGDFLRDRSFQGLEQRLDQDAPSVLEQGRSGIARGYADDHVESSQ